MKNKINYKARWRSLGYSLALACFVSLINTAAADAKTFHVSDVSRNTTNDGSSWEKPWSFYNIDWSKVQPGDTIEIDGGRSGKTYQGSLNINKSGTSRAPIRITTSTDTDHAGQVTISTGAAAPTYVGIELNNSSYVYVEGRVINNALKTKSLNIYGLVRQGIHVGQDSQNARLTNISIFANGLGAPSDPKAGGLVIEGRRTYCRNLEIFNNQTNVVIATKYGGYSPSFYNCWIHNTPVGAASGFGPASIAWDDQHDGVDIQDTYRGGFSWFYFNRCIFGPGLKNGIKTSQQNSGVYVYGSLFINAAESNVKKAITDPAKARYSYVYLNRVTSFLTPLNRQGQGHSALDLSAGRDYVYNSIFWGGSINVASSLRSYQNCQYLTSGNTVAISPTQTDPGFNADVGSITADDYSRLYSTNFSIRPGAPGYGKGALVTHSSQIK